MDDLFKNLYRKHRTLCIKRLEARGGTTYEAEDAFSSAIMAVCNRIFEKGLEKDCNYEGLLYAIAWRRLVDLFRKKAYQNIPLQDEHLAKPFYIDREISVMGVNEAQRELKKMFIQFDTKDGRALFQKLVVGCSEEDIFKNFGSQNEKSNRVKISKLKTKFICWVVEKPLRKSLVVDLLVIINRKGEWPWELAEIILADREE